jgi:hypothetical protein
VSRSSSKARGSWLRSPLSAGLSIGREQLGYVELGRAGQKWAVRRARQAPIESRLFVGDASVSTGVASLVSAVRAALDGQSPPFGPLHVSVPDAAVRWSLFELDALPGSRAAQDAFVKFRMGRDLGETHCRYTSQVLGRGSGTKQWLLGLALEEGWYQIVEQALRQSGLRAWSLSASAFRRFNFHHPRVTTRSGALVTLEPDTWSLAIWDAAGLLRHLRSQWRADDLDEREIALEIERSILGYAHGESGRTVEQIWVSAGVGTPELMSLLNARAHRACEVLEMTGALDEATPALPDFPAREAALAAALQA